MSGNYNEEGYQPFLQNPGYQPPAQPTDPSYSNPPYPQQPYAPYGAYPVYPYYAGPMASSTNGLAIASLVISITGFVATGIVGSILGVIFGHIAQGQIKRANPPEQGQGFATAGLIIGYIGIGFNVLLMGLWFAFFLLPLIVALAAASQGG